MSVNVCPNRQKFIRALVASPRATRRQMAADRREFWLGQVEDARRRVEDRQRRANALGVVDRSQDALIQIDLAALRIARGRFERASREWARYGGEQA